MAQVFTRQSILFGFLLVAFIIVFEIILARLNLPAWPAFMVMIFFFVAHEDMKAVPHILIGGLGGIFCVVLIREFTHALAPLMGEEAAKLTFIGLFVYAIVLLKDAIPSVFNSYAFMFFLVAAIAARGPGANPYVWMGIEIVVGAVFIAGILLINRVVAALLRGSGGLPDTHS